MKKLALLFAGLSLFAATGCNNDDDTRMEYPIIGTWQPTKVVVTTVAVGEDPVSDAITFDSNCQKTSRWVFAAEGSGKRTDNGEGTSPGTCQPTFDRTFSYTYDKDTKAIQIKYQGIVEADKGSVVTLNDTTLNIKIEDTSDPTEYQSKTYTLKRIPQ